MKIIVAETVPYKPHLETSGELALRFKENKNNIVKFIYLGNNLLWNDWDFPLFKKLLGFSYEKRITLFKNILKDNEIKILHENRYDDFKKIEILNWSRKFKGNFDDLKNIKYKNTPIGKSILSSLISYYRDFDLDINLYRTKVQQMLYSAVIILKRSELLIKLEKPDQLVTFNGRFSISYPIIAAAKKFRIPVLQHDRGSNFDKFEIFKKNIHDTKYRYLMAKRHWKLSKENKKKIGHSYFVDRRDKKQMGFDFGFHYLNKQKNNFLNFNIKNKKLIVFYTSTDYEQAAVSHDYQQEKKFKALYKAVSRVKNTHIIIRVHPDIKNKNVKEDLKWKKYNSDFCTVLESDDMTDSYVLLKIANMVVGYTSSILIEALYWKKKVYTLSSKNVYYHSGAIKLLKSKYNILNILNKKQKLNKIHLNKCLLFGYYFKTYGTKFKYYLPNNFSNGKFMNKNLEWKNSIILFLEKLGLKILYFYLIGRTYP